jgi:hypothetical protein
LAANIEAMRTNWISRLGHRLSQLFSWQAPDAYLDCFDRDAERLAQELDLIRVRFPHHA